MMRLIEFENSSPASNAETVLPEVFWLQFLDVYLTRIWVGSEDREIAPKCGYVMRGDRR